MGVRDAKVLLYYGEELPWKQMCRPSGFTPRTTP